MGNKESVDFEERIAKLELVVFKEKAEDETTEEETEEAEVDAEAEAPEEAPEEQTPGTQ